MQRIAAEVGYGLLATPAAFEILQGEAMGRPSALHVEVPAWGASS